MMTILVQAISTSACASEKFFEYTLPIQLDDTSFELAIGKKDEMWYVEANTLAEAAKCKININQNGKKVTLYRGNPPIALYSASKDSYFMHDSKYYLPLQDAITSVGIQFYECKDNMKAQIKRVPIELRYELESVFQNTQYQLTEMIMELGYIWALEESMARTYAVLPFVGSKPIVGVLNGKNETQRYQEAFAHILSNEGELYQTICEISEFNDAVMDYEDVFTVANEILKKGGILEQYLNKKGINKEVIAFLTEQYPPSGYKNGVEQWIQSYMEVSNALNVHDFLNICTVYSSTISAEESMILAMSLVFENSSNQYAKKAADEIARKHYGNDLKTLKGIYKEWMLETAIERLCEKIEKNLSGSPITQLKIAAATMATDYFTGASDKSNFIIFYSIYAAIQRELRTYFYSVTDYSKKETMCNLRAVGIMYLKSAIEAYKNISFDKNISTASNNALNTFTKALLKILSFSEDEYAPDYNNQCIIDWLNNCTQEQLNALNNEPMLDLNLIIGKWLNEVAYIGGPIASYGGGYYTQFKEDGTVIQNGWRNQDSGHYEIDSKNNIIATFDSNTLYSPSTADYRLLDNYTYTVVYRYNYENQTLYADYSIEFEKSGYSNAGDGILYRQESTQ